MRRLAVTSVVLSVLVFAAALQARSKPGTDSLVGTWDCIAHGAPSGDMPFTLMIYRDQSRQGYTGNASAEQGYAPITSITRKGSHLRIDINTDQDDYLLTGTLSNGKLSGEWYLDGQKQGSWQGKKEKK